MRGSWSYRSYLYHGVDEDTSVGEGLGPKGYLYVVWMRRPVWERVSVL